MIKHCSAKLTNSLDTREESFLAKTLFISQKLTRTTCARISYSFTAWNLKSCVFIPEKLTFSLCLRTKNAAKKSRFTENGVSCKVFRNLSSTVSHRPRSIYQYSNMAPRLSGQTSIFGVVFFVSKSLLGIEGQRKLEKFAILTRKPRSHAWILIYRTWPIGTDLLVLVDPSLLHHTFLLGPARFTALRISALLVPDRRPRKLPRQNLIETIAEPVLRE